jgi:hypothetical protein
MYLTLSGQQINKLKMLSLLTFASKTKVESICYELSIVLTQYVSITTLKHLMYEFLLKKLQIKSVRELEDLIIDAMYADLISGKLDQINQLFRVTRCQCRDVKVTEIGLLIQKLQSW